MEHLLCSAGVKPGSGNNKVEKYGAEKYPQLFFFFFKQSLIFLVFLQQAGLPGTPKCSSAANEGEKVQQEGLGHQVSF